MEYEFIDKSMYIEKLGTLVITDLHMGYEESLSSVGVQLPRSQYNEIIENLEMIFEYLARKGKKVKEIVILGDLKHEFGSVSKQEWNDVLELLDYLKELLGERGKIILIKGNHDVILNPIAEKRGIKIVGFYVKKEYFFMHGDREFSECFDKKIKTIVLGHKHPTITIRKEAKSEKYKCFLVGKWKTKEIVILPSFFPLVEGSDVFISETNLGVKLDLKNFEVYVPVSTEECLYFGKVKDVGILT